MTREQIENTQDLLLREVAASHAAHAAAQRAHDAHLRLLAICAGFMAAIGVTMLATGGLSTFETTLGVWTRTALGSWAALAGMVLLVGMRRCPRTVVPGLWAMFTWALAMAAGVVASMGIGGVDISLPWETTHLGVPRPYVLWVYLFFAAVTFWVLLPLARSFNKFGHDHRDD